MRYFATGLAAALIGWLTLSAGEPSVASADPSTAPKVAKRRYIVAAMGDSLTDPRSHGGKYLEVLRERCPQSVFDSYGVGGQMVNQMRKRFPRDILGEPPLPGAAKPQYTHLLMLGGINDICSDETALRTNDKIRRDLAAMFNMAKQNHIQVVAMTLPPWGGFKLYYNPRRAASTREINRWLWKQAQDGQVDALFDTRPLLSCGHPELLCEKYGWPDKVHWSKEGHRVIGAALHAQLFNNCL